jgi:hypothetical protein
MTINRWYQQLLNMPHIYRDGKRVTHDHSPFGSDDGNRTCVQNINCELNFGALHCLRGF